MNGLILIDGIYKRFRIPHHKRSTLFQNIIGFIKRQSDYEEFWALKDINLEINSGETFGIVGRNGSGKSTLLKIIARVLYPDKGRISIYGKVPPSLSSAWISAGAERQGKRLHLLVYSGHDTQGDGPDL